MSRSGASEQSRLGTRTDSASEATPKAPLSKSPLDRIANAQALLDAWRLDRDDDYIDGIERALTAAADLLLADRKAQLLAAQVAQELADCCGGNVAPQPDAILPMLGGIVTEAFRATCYLHAMHDYDAVDHEVGEAANQVDASLGRIVELIETVIGTPALTRAIDAGNRHALDICDGQADGAR